MANVFVTADTHFGHIGILRYCEQSRPFDSIEEHNEELVDRWNSVVNKRDVVWHLGDVAFGKENLHYLTRCNGLKKLVMGNHDSYPIHEYTKVFRKICGVAGLHKYVLSHVPVHESQKYRFSGNLHGHLHQRELDDPFYYNVGVDTNNLTPVPLEEINKIFKLNE